MLHIVIVTSCLCCIGSYVVCYASGFLVVFCTTQHITRFSYSKLERPSVSRPRNDNKTSAIQRRSTKLNRMTCPYLIECLSRSSQLIFSNPLSRAGTFPFNDQSKNIQIFWLFDRQKTFLTSQRNYPKL